MFVEHVKRCVEERLFRWIVAGNTFYNVANVAEDGGHIKTTLLEANCYFENFLLNISQTDVSEVEDYIGQQLKHWLNKV